MERGGRRSCLSSDRQSLLNRGSRSSEGKAWNKRRGRVTESLLLQVVGKPMMDRKNEVGGEVQRTCDFRA